MVGMGILFFFLRLGEVGLGLLVGIVRRRRRRRGNMDEVETFGGSETMMSVSCHLQGVRMGTYTYSARSCYSQQGHELARSSTST